MGPFEGCIGCCNLARHVEARCVPTCVRPCVLHARIQATKPNITTASGELQHMQALNRLRNAMATGWWPSTHLSQLCQWLHAETLSLCSREPSQAAVWRNRCRRGDTRRRGDGISVVASRTCDAKDQKISPARRVEVHSCTSFRPRGYAAPPSTFFPRFRLLTHLALNYPRRSSFLAHNQRFAPARPFRHHWRREGSCAGHGPR